MIKKKLFLTSLAMFGCLGSFAQSNEMIIQTKKPGAAIQSTMYGIFFEDINFAADGGLYAEMVANRSFEYPNSFACWDISGKVSIKDDGPFNKNPHYVRLTPTGINDKHTMIENHGFFGMGVKKDHEYRFTVWARCPEDGKAKIWVDLVDNATMTDDQKLGNGGIDISGKEWKKYTLILKAKKTIDKAHLRVWGDSKVVTDLEHVSLFPVDTWKGRENGMRKDLAQALNDMKPGIFRFPGGCIVEGTDLATRYQWKNTVGPVENRPLNENRWHYTFTNRYYPNYYQSYGLGFFEFFQLCEDFGCNALPVLNCGMACQYQNPEKTDQYVALDDLDPYIQDALDLIEFANGDASTTWGKVRADMGHPEPFNLKYMGIGNEQWDYKDNPAFTSRLKKFLDVLKAKHPEIKYIGTTGPDSEGWKFDMLQPKMKELKVDLYDEHFYRNEQWFTDSINRHRYDKYDRSKGAPKVFAGEYACHGKGKKWNHFNAALLEAAFMTGYERNADVVQMATYAPLFAHVEGWQWRPDAIWYDNLNSFKTCSYWVQYLYAHYKGTNVLPLTMNNKVVAGDSDQNGLSASAVINKPTGEIYVKVANISDQAQNIKLNLKGVKALTSGKVITLHSDNPIAENSIQRPDAIQPVEKDIEVSGSTLDTEVPAKTFAVFVLK